MSGQSGQRSVQEGDKPCRLAMTGRLIKRRWVHNGNGRRIAAKAGLGA